MHPKIEVAELTLKDGTVKEYRYVSVEAYNEVVKRWAAECAGCDGKGVYRGFVNIDPNDITKGCRSVEGLDCEDCAGIRAMLLPTGAGDSGEHANKS